MQTGHFVNTVASQEAGGVGVLIEEITSLVDKINAIDGRFLEVRRILVKTTFDTDDVFGQYRKNYLGLVWKSREIAGKAGVAGADFCDDLLDLLLPHSNSSREEIIREFEIAMAGWRNDGERDSRLSHDFEELLNTLKNFGTVLTERISRATDAEARLRADIDRLDAEIARMDVNGGAPMLRQLSLVISGACNQARHACQEVGMIPALLTAVNMLSSFAFVVVCKSFSIANVVLMSCLRGSLNIALDTMFSAVHEAFDKIQHFKRSLEASSGQRVAFQGDLRARISALEENRHEIQLAINKGPDIFAVLDTITADMSSLSSEVTSLNDIFNLLTAETAEILLLLRSNALLDDLTPTIVALRTEYSPIGKALAAYARAQTTRC